MHLVKRLAIAGAFGLSGGAMAGSSTGPVTIMVYKADLVVFDTGSHADKPTCSAAGNNWAVSLTTPGGRAIYAALLAAQAQGRSVQVIGTGGCSDWPDRETPMAISIQ
jgi:hypothetical protein